MDGDEDLERQRLRQQQALEQGMQVNLDVIPAYFWSLYQRYQEAGFTKEEALRLVCCQAAGGVKL